MQRTWINGGRRRYGWSLQQFAGDRRRLHPADHRRRPRRRRQRLRDRGRRFLTVLHLLSGRCARVAAGAASGRVRRRDVPLGRLHTGGSYRVRRYRGRLVEAVFTRRHPAVRDWTRRTIARVVHY